MSPTMIAAPAFPSVLLPADRVALVASSQPSPAPPIGSSSPNERATSTREREWPPVYAHQGQGTADNPLIPKRRRRTSPEELRVLEAEFQRNPLPSQAQRAALSAKLGMTGRALQVWFQNRRQKEKKDASSYQGTSGASSTGSATDPDRDAADLEGLSFAMSSSPAPTPVPTRTCSNYLDAKALESLPSSEQIYRRSDANKENRAIVSSDIGAPNGNVAVAPPTSSSRPSAPVSLANGSSFHTWHISAASTAPIRHTYTIPAAKTTLPLPVYARSATATGTKADGATSPQANTFQHRSSTTSVIAAKKHVRRRPLGSHAPTARKPSLSHAFNFPASPDASAPSHDSRLKPPTLRRSASSASINSNTSETFSLQTNESGRAHAVWFESQHSDEGSASHGECKPCLTQAATTAPKTTTATTTATTTSCVRGFKTRDEVWQHMQSDAPSSPGNSPAPLTRKMMMTYAQTQSTKAMSSRHVMLSSEDAPSSDMDALYEEEAVATAASIAARSRRPTLARAMSLGGAPSGPAAEGSRAGGEEACAISALERKRQRVLETAYAAGPVAKAPRHSSSSNSSGRSANGRSSSAAPSRRLSNGVAAPRRSTSTDKTAARKIARIVTTSTAPTSSTPSSAHVKLSASPSEKSVSPADESVDENDDSSSSMGDLSFSSTSTTSTASSIGTPTVETGSYFSLARSLHHPTTTTKREVNADEERECAELLLGLGGGFCA